MTAFRFIERERAHHRVSTMCEVLGVSPSGFWAWQGRGPSPRSVADAELTGRIAEAHARSRGTYGAPRVHAELAATGIACGRKRVARLMRAAGIAGIHRRRYHATTVRDPGASPAADLLHRDFTTTGPDRFVPGVSPLAPDQPVITYPPINRKSLPDDPINVTTSRPTASRNVART